MPWFTNKQTNFAAAEIYHRQIGWSILFVQMVLAAGKDYNYPKTREDCYLL